MTALPFCGPHGSFGRLLRRKYQLFDVLRQRLARSCAVGTEDLSQLTSLSGNKFA